MESHVVYATPSDYWWCYAPVPHLWRPQGMKSHSQVLAAIPR